MLIKNLYDKLRFFPNPNPILPIKSDNWSFNPDVEPKLWFFLNLKLCPIKKSELIRKIRLFETVRGSTQKVCLESEKPILRKLGKSIVYSKDLKVGDVLTEENI